MINSNHVLCFGDSITRGIPGVSYLNYLDLSLYLNYGKGGDTLTIMTRRLSKLDLSSLKLHFIIEIGTNDILLPYLVQTSSSWKKRINLTHYAPIGEVSLFKKQYNQLLNHLKGHHVTIINIPCIGESLASTLNQKVDTYNQIIASCCKQHDIPIIDFNSWQKQHLSLFSPSYFMTKHPIDVMIDTMLTTYGGQSQAISKKRNLNVTIDGVHLNEFAAKQLAKMISQQR